MTSQQTARIEALRRDGYGYRAIADATGMNLSTVTSWCRRHGLGGNRGSAGRPASDTVRCIECGLPLRTATCGRQKRFCSQACRTAHGRRTRDGQPRT